MKVTSNTNLTSVVQRHIQCESVIHSSQLNNKIINNWIKK